MTSPPRYSLVVPFYNEAGNISPLIATAVEVLDTLPHPYEIILVNDGSTDATAAEISACIARWPQCRALHQPRNLGQATALLDGLRSARGEILLAMDGDGQNDPRDFPLLLAPVEAGTLDVACGWRHDRHDSWLRRRMSRLANLVRGRVLGAWRLCHSLAPLQPRSQRVQGQISEPFEARSGWRFLNAWRAPAPCRGLCRLGL